MPLWSEPGVFPRERTAEGHLTPLNGDKRNERTREQQSVHPFTGVVTHLLGKITRGPFAQFQYLVLDPCPFAVTGAEDEGLRDCEVAVLFYNIVEERFEELPEVPRDRARHDGVVEQRFHHVHCQKEMGICCDAELCQIGIALIVEVKDLFDSFYDRQGTWVAHVMVDGGSQYGWSFVATMNA